MLADRTITYAASTNGIKNNLILLRDVMVVNDMIGLSMHAVKGMTARA